MDGYVEIALTECGDKYEAKEDGKAKVLVVAQPMRELVKT